MLMVMTMVMVMVMVMNEVNEEQKPGGERVSDCECSPYLEAFL